MNSFNQYKIIYTNKLIINLLKNFKINRNNISLNEIRTLICILIIYRHINNFTKVLDILLEYDNNYIIKLFLYYKNKISISIIINIITCMRYDIIPNDIPIYYIDSKTVTPLFDACHYRRKKMIKF